MTHSKPVALAARPGVATRQTGRLLLAGLIAAACGALALFALAPGQVQAGDLATADSKAVAAITTSLTSARPGLVVSAVTETPLKGIYQVAIAGGQVIYASADGRYLIAGDLLEVRGNDLVNLAELERNDERKALLAQVSRDDMVVFPAVGPTKAEITVFTDVDCGYCQKLHREVPQMNAMGIEVRYLAFPRGYGRSGEAAPSYKKIVSAWCADDRLTAMTRLKQGMPVAEASCASPVKDQYELGVKMGVRGTPAMVTSDGRMLPGYMPAADLANTLGVAVPADLAKSS